VPVLPQLGYSEEVAADQAERLGKGGADEQDDEDIQKRRFRHGNTRGDMKAPGQKENSGPKSCQLQGPVQQCW